MRTAIASLSLLIIPALHYGATTPADVDRTVQRFIEDGSVAGAVTLVARDGEVLESGAFGKADIEAGRPMRKDTIFQVMSMTKPFTAVGIMMLAEEGKLAIRDPVERYLPEFHNQKVWTPVGSESQRMSVPIHSITIQELLSHTSGMQDPAPGSIRSYPQQMDVSLAEVVRQLAKEPLLFQPGTHWSYSSPGIEVLGRIIEVCSDKPYEQFIKERILQPLGMKDSFFFPSGDKIDRIAMVYTKREGKLQRAPGTILGGDPTLHRKGAVFPAPGWGLYSTAEDLLKFYRMMLNGGTLEGRRYLQPFTVQLMTRPFTTGIRPAGWMGGSDYGLAWEVVTEPLGEAAGHSIGTYGHGGAFGTQGWIDPKTHRISILLIQLADSNSEALRYVFLNMAETLEAR